MDKTAFNNMNLGEFISSIIDNLSIEFNKAIVKRLLSDIIDIYEGHFLNYDTYKDFMLDENSSIDYSFNYSKNDFKLNYVYIPKHIILEEFAYNYIICLSKRGDE